MMNRTLEEIGALIVSQDNASTHLPMFIVQQRRRNYGYDPDYTDDVAWIDVCNDSVEADTETAARLEAARNRFYAGDREDCENDPENGCWERTAYVDTWEFVTVCFTRVAAEEYIADNRHRMTDPRIYVDSAYRNREWETIREHLRSLASRELSA